MPIVQRYGVGGGGGGVEANTTVANSYTRPSNLFSLGTEGVMPCHRSLSALLCEAFRLKFDLILHCVYGAKKVHVCAADPVAWCPRTGPHHGRVTLIKYTETSWRAATTLHIPLHHALPQISWDFRPHVSYFKTTNRSWGNVYILHIMYTGIVM